VAAFGLSANVSANAGDGWDYWAPDDCSTSVLPDEAWRGDDGDGIYWILALIINILTGAIGIACTVGIVWSGIIWGTAAGDIGKVKMAQKRIIEIVTGMVVLALMWAFLNWLIPGGVFN
jgi:hypothetical protein